MDRSVRDKTILPDGSETFGERLARFRKERGYTQTELAERTGLIQALISDYERNKLRPYADVVAKIAQGMGVSADELLGLAPVAKANGPAQHRRFLRRLQLIDKLPKRDRDAVLRTIDALLAARRAS